VWVRIVRERRFLLPEDHRVCIHFTAGLVVSVKRRWGEHLIQAGDAVEAPTPPRRSVTG
jgi:hypothetical protein